eukprot:gene17945-biopygen1322
MMCWTWDLGAWQASLPSAARVVESVPPASCARCSICRHKHVGGRREPPSMGYDMWWVAATCAAKCLQNVGRVFAKYAQVSAEGFLAAGEPRPLPPADIPPPMCAECWKNAGKYRHEVFCACSAQAAGGSAVRHGEGGGRAGSARRGRSRGQPPSKAGGSAEARGRLVVRRLRRRGPAPLPRDREEGALRGCALVSLPGRHSEGHLHGEGGASSWTWGKATQLESLKDFHTKLLAVSGKG